MKTKKYLVLIVVMLFMSSLGFLIHGHFLLWFAKTIFLGLVFLFVTKELRHLVFIFTIEPILGKVIACEPIIQKDLDFGIENNYNKKITIELIGMNNLNKIIEVLHFSIRRIDLGTVVKVRINKNDICESEIVSRFDIIFSVLKIFALILLLYKLSVLFYYDI